MKKDETLKEFGEKHPKFYKSLKKNLFNDLKLNFMTLEGWLNTLPVDSTIVKKTGNMLFCVETNTMYMFGVE